MGDSAKYSRLLLVSHCPSENTAELRDSAVRGIASLQFDNLDVVSKTPLDTTPQDVLACDAVIIGSTENFGAMAGLIKDFFERVYYPCLDKTLGLPVAVYIRAGEDGSGARAGIEKILTGLRWRLIAEPLVLRGAYDAQFCERVSELAMTMAAGIDAEIF